MWILALNFFFIFIVIYQWTGKTLLSVIKSFVIFSLFITAILEVTSLFDATNHNTIFTIWLLILLIVNIIVFKNNKPLLKISVFQGTVRQIIAHIILFIFATVLLFLAIKVPPNNFDSWSYHLPRVEHWIQNNNIKFYPTNKLNQLFMPPLSEYFMLNLNLLSGNSDLYSNLVQWISMIISLVATVLISKTLLATSTTSLLTTLVTITIPMGILQSTSSQTDYSLSSFIAISVYLVIASPNNRPLTFSEAFFLGSSFGLALLTKTTALIFLAPFVFWLFLKQVPFKPILQFITISIIFLLINFGQFYRNNHLFKSPIGINSYGYEWRNLSFSPPVIFSNLLRNSSIHLATPDKLVNKNIYQLIMNVHHFLNIDPHDPQSTWTNTPYTAPDSNIREDTSGNTLHFIFFIIASVFSLIYSQKTTIKRQLLLYTLSVWMGYFIFSIVLKWQPWHSRLQLPLFVLASPVIAYFISTQIKPTKYLLSAIFLLCSLPYLLMNPNKPVVGKINIFNYQSNLRYIPYNQNISKIYSEITSFIRSNNCRYVGLVLENESPEYPFWIQKAPSNSPRLVFNDLNVNNVSAGLLLADNHQPCAIISNNKQQSQIINNTVFTQKYSYHELLNVLLP